MNIRSKDNRLPSAASAFRSRIFFLATTLWTALLSACSGERIVYQTESEFNKIFVYERPGGIRSLRFSRGGAVQSIAVMGNPKALLLPYTRVSILGLAFVDDPVRILVVGLGGGSIPRFIHASVPSAQVEVVELDPVVNEVASEWFGLVEDARLRVTVADGRDFVENVEDPYDVIFLDAYGSESVPAALTSREFLTAVRRAVKPDGAVVANIWGPATNQLYGSMATTYQDVFDELFIFPVGRRSNRILVALPRGLEISPLELAARVDELQERLGGHLDLSELMPSHDPRSTHEDFGGSVLLDSAFDREER